MTAACIFAWHLGTGLYPGGSVYKCLMCKLPVLKGCHTSLFLHDIYFCFSHRTEAWYSRFFKKSLCERVKCERSQQAIFLETPTEFLSQSLISLPVPMGTAAVYPSACGVIFRLSLPLTLAKLCRYLLYVLAVKLHLAGISFLCKTRY